MLLLSACIIATLWALILVGLYVRSLFNENPKPMLLDYDPKKHLYYLKIILGFAILFRLPYMFFTTFSDESFYIYAARLIAKGCGQYTCFFLDQPPLYPNLTALLFKIMGVGVFQAKLLPFAFSIASILLVYRLSKMLYGLQAALFSTTLASTTLFLAYFTATANLYSGLVFFCLLAAYLSEKGCRGGGDRVFFAAGLSVGVASMFRLLAPITLAAILAGMYGGKGWLKKSLLVFSGFLASLLAIVFVFNSPEFIYQVFLSHLHMPSPGYWNKAVWFITKTIPLYGQILVFTPLLARIRWRPRGQTERILAYQVLLVAAAILFLKYPYPVNQRMYFTMAAAPLAIILGNIAVCRPGKYFTKNHFILVTLGLFIAPNTIMLANEMQYTFHAYSAAKYVESQNPGQMICLGGAHHVAFMAEAEIPPNLLILDYARMNSGEISIKDLQRLPEGTLLAQSINGTDEGEIQEQFMEWRQTLNREFIPEKQYGQIVVSRKK